MLAALVLSLSLGSEALFVDEGFTSAAHTQSESSLALDGPFVPGDVLFGYFPAGPQDWSAVESLSINASWIGSNPGVVFDVTLLDDEYQAIGTYQGSTTFLEGSFTLIPLQLTESGAGDAARLIGLEIRWNGAGEGGSAFVIQSLVGSADPIVPVVTSAIYADGQFTMTWSGTGALPVNIQRRESLVSGEWITVAQGVGAGQYTDSSPPVGRAFYRVVVP